MSGSVAVIVVQHAAQSIPPPDGAAARCKAWVGCNQPVSESLVVPFSMVQLSNTTPMLGIFVKSAIPGTHGTAGKCGCMPVW